MGYTFIVMVIMMILVAVFFVLALILFCVWGGLDPMLKRRDRYGREWVSEYINPIPSVFHITGMALKYIGGLGLTVGWIWAIIVSLTYGGSVYAFLFAVFLGPVFAIVEAFWWGNWIPLILCWPSFGLYLIGVKLDGGRR